MGQARRRGSFEDRKEQAIKAGRIKKESDNSYAIAMGTYFVLKIGNFMLNGLRTKNKRAKAA